MTSNLRWDIAQVAQAAAGKWPVVIRQLTGIAASNLTGKYGPCPKCGGKDRWRTFADFEQTGGANCFLCGRMADGFALLQNLRNCSFPESLQLVAELLNIEPLTNDLTMSNQDPAKLIS